MDRTLPLRIGSVDVASGLVALANGERRRRTGTERALLEHLAAAPGSGG